MTTSHNFFSIEGKVFQEIKSSLANMEPHFVLHRYNKYNDRRVKLYSVFDDDFDKTRDAQSLYENAETLRDEATRYRDLPTYEQKVRKYFEAVIAFLEILPEAEIKRAQSAYRQSNRRRKKRYSYSENRPYRGECDRDYQIQRLANYWGISKKAAIEKAVDLALETITIQAP